MQRETGSLSATHIRWGKHYSYPIFFLETAKWKITKNYISNPNSSVIGDLFDA
jgi:hypothetical protein